MLSMPVVVLSKPFYFNAWRRIPSVFSNFTIQRSSLSRTRNAYRQKMTVKCETAEDIESVGSEASSQARPGTVFLLEGDIGCGKTCFARGLIRRLLQDEKLLVTSPSYLLDNTYETAEGLLIHHLDLYRLPKSFDASVLGIPHIFERSVSLIEWPDRLDLSSYPSKAIKVSIDICNDQSRLVNINHSNFV